MGRLTYILGMKTILVACLAVVGFAVGLQAAEKIGEISHDELKAAIAKGKVFLVDVNGTESFNGGHIPGAIDYIANKDKFAALLPKDKSALIVAYCGNEKCGVYKKAADAAVALGYTNVKHYAPGIAGWKAKEKTESVTASAGSATKKSCCGS